MFLRDRKFEQNDQPVACFHGSKLNKLYESIFPAILILLNLLESQPTATLAIISRNFPTWEKEQRLLFGIITKPGIVLVLQTSLSTKHVFKLAIYGEDISKDKARHNFKIRTIWSFLRFIWYKCATRASKAILLHANKQRHIYCLIGNAAVR